MTETVRIERGRYHDSVTLMRASAAARDIPGVETVIAAMGTELNRALLVQAGFAEPDATADDLVVAVSADSPPTAEAAVAAVDRQLAERADSGRRRPAGADRPAHRRVGGRPGAGRQRRRGLGPGAARLRRGDGGAAGGPARDGLQRRRRRRRRGRAQAGGRRARPAGDGARLRHGDPRRRGPRLRQRRRPRAGRAGGGVGDGRPAAVLPARRRGDRRPPRDRGRRPRPVVRRRRRVGAGGAGRRSTTTRRSGSSAWCPSPRTPVWPRR